MRCSGFTLGTTLQRSTPTCRCAPGTQCGHTAKNVHVPTFSCFVFFVFWALRPFSVFNKWKKSRLGGKITRLIFGIQGSALNAVNWSWKRWNDLTLKTHLLRFKKWISGKCEATGVGWPNFPVRAGLSQRETTTRLTDQDQQRHTREQKGQRWLCGHPNQRFPAEVTQQANFPPRVHPTRMGARARAQSSPLRITNQMNVRVSLCSHKRGSYV